MTMNYYNISEYPTAPQPTGIQGAKPLSRAKGVVIIEDIPN